MSPKGKVLLIGIGIVILVGLGFVFSRNESSVVTSEPKGKVTQGSAKELYEKAGRLQQDNELQAAKETYKSIITDYPDFNGIENVQKDLETLNMRLILSAVDGPNTVVHEVQTGDSLAKIAKKYNTTVELIKKSNNLESDIIRLGQRIRIWKGVFSVLVDKSQNNLMLKSDNELVKVYRVATGKNNCTPVGTFTITTKLVDPVWYKSGAIISPEYPENALGSRWMGFDLAGYGIHGTNQPDSIGKQVTQGCVRMKKDDVEELYSILPVGTQVTIVD